MRKNEVDNVEKLEQYYSKIRKIRFKDGVSIKQIKTIKRLLFNDSAPTFFIKGKEHCKEYKLRSVDDYFNLCKTYFPNKTLKDFAKIWLEDERKKELNNKKRILLRYCPNINRHNSGGLMLDTYSWLGKALKYNEKLEIELELGLKKRFSFKEIING